MNAFLKQVLTPIVGRVGTFVAGVLSTNGVPNDLTSQLVLAGGVVLSLAFDVGVILLAKRRTTR